MIRINKLLLDYVEKQSKSNFDIVHFKPDDIIMKQGSYVKNIYIVKDGLLKCSLYNEDGLEFIQEFFSQGEILGEIETVLDNSKTIATIEAITHLSCYKISIRDFKNLLLDDKEFNNLLIKELANKTRYKALRHSFIQTHTLEQNLENIKQENPEIFSIVSKNDLANYFGVTVRSINRTIKNMN